jgi:hypothetical protein
MRPRRMLMMMAGVVKTPFEKHYERQQRKLEKLNREWKQDLEFVAAIQARERGDDGAKPMPFAKTKEVKS